MLPGLLAAAGITLAGAASAQTTEGQPGVQDGVQAQVGTALVYDSNLFWEPEGTSDFFWRISPKLTAQRRLPRLTVVASYTFDAERFMEQSEESTPLARQRAALDLTGQPNAGTTLRVVAAYATTSTPYDFNATTGLGPGRYRARNWENDLRVTQALSPRTKLNAGYALQAQFARELGDIVTHTGEVGLAHQIGARDTALVRFFEQRFSFDPGDVVASRGAVVGWERRVSPYVSVGLEGGPRYTFQSFKPEIGAKVNVQLRRSVLGLAYFVTQTTAVGLPSTIDVRRLEGQVTHRLARRAEGLVRGTLFVNTLGARVSHVYRLSGGVEGAVTDTLRLSAAYSNDFLTGNLYRGPESELSLRRHVFAFGLTVVPWRAP